MNDLKPLTLHVHPGPTPWKVAVLLEELHVPYNTKLWMTPQLKQPEYLALNRNGMAPVIEDPNTGLTLFESGAIIDYVLEKYDNKENRLLTFPPLSHNHFHMRQWIHYQNTAQGPTLQRIRYWTLQDPKPEVRAMYLKEFKRVCKVLDDELAQRGGDGKEKEWLVGDKCSAADLVFFPFHSRVGVILGEDAKGFKEEYPHVDAWYQRMVERDAVKKVKGDMADALQQLIQITKAAAAQQKEE